MALKATLISILCLGIHVTLTQNTEDKPIEYPPYDGWYNNYAHPSWGGADTQLFRKVPPAYSDGSYEPAGMDRPSPMNLSRVVFTGPTGHKSYKGRTALLVFFGQQLVEEILDAQRAGCPPEYINLDIPKEHEHYSEKPGVVNVLPVLRTRYDMKTGYSPNNPRQQLNEISAWMDGTLVYGPNKAWTDSIREFKDGLLQVDDVKGPYGGEFPRNNTIRLPYINPPPPRDHPKLKPVARFNKIGNPRGNENPFLLTMGIMWFRYHNYWARSLKAEHPSWSDEKLFNEARKMVIGVYQKIATEDWLPNWLGEPLESYKGYDPSVHPGITHVFQSAAMRFGHTMVPPGVYRRDKNCFFRNTTKQTYFEDKVAVRTCNSFWNPQEAVYEHDIDELIMGMASQIAEREDNIITPDLRGNVFGSLEFNRRDLMAINIQRGRDHGIPDFNSVRKAYGLEPKQWSNIIVHPDIDEKIIDQIKEMYNGDVNKVDLWVGGMLEVNEGPGETFKAIIKDQFQRIRDGDRFWFENKKNGLYTEDEIQFIKKTTVKDVIMATTKIGPSDIQENPFNINGNPCDPPYGQLNHSNGLMEDCTDKETFDYFSGSEVSFVLSLLVLFATFFVFLGILKLLAKHHKKIVSEERSKARKKSLRKLPKEDRLSSVFAVSEWQGPKKKWHDVCVKLNKGKKLLNVTNPSNVLLRSIDFKCMVQRGIRSVDIYLSVDGNMDLLLIKIPQDYDLILKFDNVGERQKFSDSFKQFLGDDMRYANPRGISAKLLLLNAHSKEQRKGQLKNFFQAIFAHLTEEHDQQAWGHLNKKQIQEVINYEMTKFEFAEVLNVKMNSMFLESMFRLIDTDHSGTISFREFLDLCIVFFKGSGENKMRILFDMYADAQTKSLSRNEFKTMLKSLGELNNHQIEESKLETLIERFFNEAGLGNSMELTFKDFKTIFEKYQNELNQAVLDFNVDLKMKPKHMKLHEVGQRNKEILESTYCNSSDIRRTNRMSVTPWQEIKVLQDEYPNTRLKQWMNTINSYVENYKLHIFWVTLYTLVCIGIFIERAYYYSVEREHSGLRRIAGDGVTVTRGAASGMMFTYGCLLVTMCRNIITVLRETFLHRYIPFDAAVDFHKYISLLALIFTLLHIIGHCINFYHVSTQTADDLSCLFRNFFHATDELPKFHDWLWVTVTGFTGVLLTVQMFMIYLFAIQYSRRHSFRSFWITHNSYFIFFLLMFLHGMGRLVQPPFSHYFMLGPIVLFAIDQLISASRKKIEISVVRVELLPSDVIYLEIKKPYNFAYKSGQWVRIACPEQDTNEYHPFTLSSAPHEENLGVHIRSVGPWTYRLRETYNPDILQHREFPKVLLDGPYGEGHQDWYKFEVAVLVGGGIGVTPFASILKDIAHKSKSGRKIFCKKVYFLWVTRNQKQFEWMTDIISDVENTDEKDLVSVHIFITEFKQKFDIRTTLLYICENYFQKISGRSMLTGLQSITHFGRPDFKNFLEQVHRHHIDASLIGVFSCGPPPMTATVEKACKFVTSSTDACFVHHYENF